MDNMILIVLSFFLCIMMSLVLGESIKNREIGQQLKKKEEEIVKIKIPPKPSGAQHPSSGIHHGGSEEHIINIIDPGFIRRFQEMVTWEAEAQAGLKVVDFFTYDLGKPDRLVVGRHYAVGDLIGENIVVTRDGTTVLTMPPKAAREFFDEQRREKLKAELLRNSAENLADKQNKWIAVAEEVLKRSQKKQQDSERGDWFMAGDDGTLDEGEGALPVGGLDRLPPPGPEHYRY